MQPIGTNRKAFDEHRKLFLHIGMLKKGCLEGGGFVFTRAVTRTTHKKSYFVDRPLSNTANSSISRQPQKPLDLVKTTLDQNPPLTALTVSGCRVPIRQRY